MDVPSLHPRWLCDKYSFGLDIQYKNKIYYKEVFQTPCSLPVILMLVDNLSSILFILICEQEQFVQPSNRHGTRFQGHTS